MITFKKSLYGLCFEKNNFNMEKLKLLLNGYILIHKNKEVIGVINNLDYLSEHNKEDSIIGDFFNEDYDLWLVKKGCIIQNPKDADFEYVNKHRLMVKYTTFIKYLKAIGYQQNK